MEAELNDGRIMNGVNVSPRQLDKASFVLTRYIPVGIPTGRRSSYHVK